VGNGDDDAEEDEEEYVRPVLPGDEPDFWEGPQWNALGFVVQYLWAIGIVVAVSLFLPISRFLVHVLLQKWFLFHASKVEGDGSSVITLLI
jgi:hypothetical protein